MLLDTCAIVFDALVPEKLGEKAKAEIEKGRLVGTLACSDISLWEIAMLIGKGRLKPDAQTTEFLQLVVAANRLQVLPISSEIASLSAQDQLFSHNDPADRIIAATAIYHKMPLLTSDRELKKVKGLKTIW
jgi:PIN domain nuclease of toxin-antitoxin system